MIAVTDLPAYLFCPRKLYFKKVLHITEKPKEKTLRGTIVHRVFELSGKEDQDIVRSFTEKNTLEEIEMRYRHIYSNVLLTSILYNKEALRDQGVDARILYQELWPFFLEEAKAKSKALFSQAHEKKMFGDALWNELPKSSPEIKIVSEKLGMTGVIDRLEEGYIPVEIKTGKPPREDVWKEHRIQLGAYMLLLKEHLEKDVTYGFIEYSLVNERRKVIMNPFLKDEILALIGNVRQLLQQPTLPEKIKEEWKCTQCGIREECFNADKN